MIFARAACSLSPEVVASSSFLRPSQFVSPEVTVVGNSKSRPLRNTTLGTRPGFVTPANPQPTSSVGRMGDAADAIYDDFACASNYEKCHKINFNFGSTSTGKMPRRRPRRIIYPNSFYRDFVPQACNVRWPFTTYDLLYYQSVLHYAQEPAYKMMNVIDYGGVKVNFYTLAESMRRDSTSSVDQYVINALCCKLFKDSHPRQSRKHYFFSTVGDYLMGNYEDYAFDRMRNSAQKSFKFANTMKDLMTCDILFFPIFYENHWFVFIVDIRDNYFIFLDCFFDEESDYQTRVRSTLLPAFIQAWDEFTNLPFHFEDFSIHYAQVPKLKPGPFFRKVDDGVFTMKFLELWDPYQNMMAKFTSRHIGDIRVLYVNEMVFSKHNLSVAAKRLVYNYKSVENAKHSQVSHGSSSYSQASHGSSSYSFSPEF